MTTKFESDADRQERYDREKQKEVDAYERDPAKATERGRKDAFDRMKEGYKAQGLTEDINSMVHPEGDDPVEPRGSGKDGVPAGTEDMLKANKRNQPGSKATGPDGQVKEQRSLPSDRSTDPADRNAPKTVDPADGSTRTKDGVK